MNHQKVLKINQFSQRERERVKENNEFLLFNIFPLNLILETKIILQVILLDLPCDFEELNLSPHINGRLREILSLKYVKRAPNLQVRNM